MNNSENNLLLNQIKNNTLFINLENRHDRCSHIKKELFKLGITTPNRFNAIKTNMGQVGCSMSHLKCLEKAKNECWEYVFICEDDAVFTNPKLLLERFSKAMDLKWDVFIVGGNNQRPFFSIVENEFIQVHNCQTTTAYIVKSSYYEILIQNIKESLERLLREPKLKHLFSIDIYWKKLQIKDNWIMSIPATVSQLDGVSDIEGRTVSYNNLMLDYEKKWMNEPLNSGQVLNTFPMQPSLPQKNPVFSSHPSRLNGSGWNKGFLNTMPKQGSIK